MASSLRACAAFVTAAILWAGPASAQKAEPPVPPPPNTPAPTEAPAPRARPARPGPAPRAIPAHPRRKAWVPRGKHARDVPLTPGMPIASFPGFARLDDGKSRIFIEVTDKVDVAEKRDPSRLIYRLRGTTVMQRTNELPLITGFFSTPVDRVQLVQDGPDVNVIIDVREVTEATSRVIETPRGMVLWIDFPKSVTFGRENDGDGQVDRPRARRSANTQSLGSVGGSTDDLPPPAVQDR